MTRDLFDLIIELRPSTTSAGLAENFKYVYLEVSKRSRQAESSEYLRTLSGVCISLDNTFKAAGKATVADKQKTRTKFMRGGMLTAINEDNEILFWRLCQTQANTEMEELLEGLKSRYEKLDQPLPQMVIVDNCCHVRSAVNKAMPDAQVGLDVFHFIMRYLAAILNGTRNPQCLAVAHDISKAILSSRASGNGESAKYQTKEEQEVQLQTMFEKWAEKGGVWSAAASKVHADHLLSTEPTHSNNSQELKARPFLSSINTKESFGLGPSNHSSIFGGLIEVKTEANFDEQDLSLDQLDLDAEIEPTSILQCLDIDPNLLTVPQITLGKYPFHHDCEMMAITEPTALANSSQSGPLKRKVPFYDLTEDLGPLAGALEGPLQKKSCIPTAQETTANTLSTSATNAPSTPATNASSIQAKGTPSTSNIISMFFAPGSKTVAPKCPSDKHTSQNLMAAFSPLADPNLNGLSRFQRIFSILTGIDPRSLTLNSSAKFFLFMDMRLQNKWALFSMTSQKWVLATADYNSRLEKLPKSGGSPAVMKNPRALFDKLGEIETKIVKRIKSNNFHQAAMRSFGEPIVSLSSSLKEKTQT
ncbi:hypothetical protein SERLADRAFT_438585 [Serpula lacrymans var. lacrymans S7.9]|uniref:Uncharacterized protein n=1 Tax=Serpula lacrymans var. lacrymans (strain S7.9) TaxID=578457 RepID=F8NWB4_SERL9|nr:uncharacterized protein SERLADRAFT_438585 [Serpula lacrymans var. lacrymans S7.9]EGO24993.1 hypothetical protein SERLADRAFT_438585 [Serpula lacrymans var. lacrymans S7.9]